MSDENKKSIYERAKDWTVILGIITIIAGGAKWIHSQGQREEAEKHVEFSSPAMKIATEGYIEDVNAVDIVRQQMKDSIQHRNDSIAEAKFRRVQDSVDAVRDSLTRLNTRMIYNNSRKSDSILILLKQSN